MALAGIRVLELAGLAPAPFAGMVLADFGAKVTRVDKTIHSSVDTMARGKRSIAINLKKETGQSIVRRLSAKSDVIIEPFRPGVMEKLGLGPERLMRDNPRLIYVRLSGYGQDGPYKMKAGHDINYISTSGILSMFRRSNGQPHPPVNLAADFAGGGLMAAFGTVAALFEREKSGRGQIVDTNMVEGSAYISSFLFTCRYLFCEPPGENVLDSGAPFYDTYRTKDGKFMSVGAIEPQFFAQLIKGFDIDEEFLSSQMDRKKWPELRGILTEKFAKLTREEATVKFADVDACVAPVLERHEAPLDPHNKSIGSFFTDPDGTHVPSPTPRLSRTPATPDQGGQPLVGAHSREVLLENGFQEREITELIDDDVIMEARPPSRL